MLKPCYADRATCVRVQLTLTHTVKYGDGRVAFAIVLGVFATMPLAAVRAGPTPIFKGATFCSVPA